MQAFFHHVRSGAGRRSSRPANVAINVADDEILVRMPSRCAISSASRAL